MGFHHLAHDQIPTGQPVATSYNFTALAPPSFPSRPGSSVLIDCRPEGSSTMVNFVHPRISKDTRSRCRDQLITFDMLPDDVLLEVFALLVDENMDEDMDEDSEQSKKQRIEKWITLAHVCRRWRSVVLQSPLRLNLRLVCTPKTPTRDTLDTWPSFPLIIRGFDNHPVEPFIEDNILAALEHNDRVCEIQLIRAELGYFIDSAAILKPFPELTFLELSNLNWYAYEGPEPILPDSFLGGTAPRLRSLSLDNVPFAGLPKLLSSATHLVSLSLVDILRSGYIPPEVMASSLSALTSLELLRLSFLYPPPRPALETRRPPPPPLTRSILPSLTKIEFKGASEYLEVILARIDAPRLDELHIAFFNQILFDTPQLYQFISRLPSLRTPEIGHIEFSSEAVTVGFPSQTSDYDVFSVRVQCTPSEWQLSSLEQVCASLPPISTLEDLYIFEDQGDPPRWQDDGEYPLWLVLLHSFVSVKDLYVSEEFVPRIAPALQELVGGRTTEVFPALDNILLEGFQSSRPLQEGMENFVAARLLTSRPVAISRWDRKEGDP